MTTNCKNSQATFEKDLEKSFCVTSFSTNNETEAPLKGLPVKRGELFGEFNLGSTIVLIFEAPENFEFNINQNEKVFYGNKLGSAVFSSYL
jgi:phosphatidylserine decarboxylase